MMISFLEKWFDNENLSYDAKISERVQTLFLNQCMFMLRTPFLTLWPVPFRIWQSLIFCHPHFHKKSQLSVAMHKHLSI